MERSEDLGGQLTGQLFFQCSKDFLLIQHCDFVYSKKQIHWNFFINKVYGLSTIFFNYTRKFEES